MYIAEEQDSYESLDDIRRAILNSFDEKKLFFCIKFHDKSRKMCTKQKNKSNITYMSKTIKPGTRVEVNKIKAYSLKQ